MLAAVLRARPGVRGILVDLPSAVARSGAVFADPGVADQATAVGQSFFDPLPRGGDVYILRGVLNDWSDAQAVAILRRCAETGGRVVVIKGIGTAAGLTEEMVLVGGRTRTVEEMGELARMAGLSVVAIGRQGSGTFVMECRPGIW